MDVWRELWERAGSQGLDVWYELPEMSGEAEPEPGHVGRVAESYEGG